MRYTDEEINHNRRTAAYERLGFITDWAHFMAESPVEIDAIQGYLNDGCPHETAVALAV